MKTPFSIEYDLKNLDKIVSDLKEYIAKLEKTAEDKVGRIFPIHTYKQAPYYELTERSDYYYGKKTPAEATKLLEEWLEECKKIKFNNEIAITNNIKVHEEVFIYLKAIGLSEKVDIRNPKKRSRDLWVRGDAPWIDSINKGIPRNDGWYSVEETYKNKLAAIKKFEDNIREANRIACEEAQKIIDKQNNDIELARLMIKYGVKDITNLLKEILNKDGDLEWNYDTFYSKYGSDTWDEFMDKLAVINPELHSAITTYLRLVNI